MVVNEMMQINNDSLNQSSLVQYHDDDSEFHWNVMDIVESVVSPVIVIVGLIGNALGAATLLRVAGLRYRGIGHLLVAICVSDTIFLGSLLPMWLGSRYGRDYDLYNSDGWCELLSLTTMSSNFLSTWFTVALGVERYGAVRHCRHHVLTVNGRGARANAKTTKTYYGPTRTRVAIIALTVLAIVVFVNMVVNIGAIKDPNGVTHCVPLQPAVDAMHVLNKIDLVVNVIAPNFIIIGLYTATGVRLTAYHCRRSRAIILLAPPRPTRVDDRASFLIEIRLTKTALLLSIVVLLLSVPSHAARTAYVVVEIFRLPVPVPIGSIALQLVIRKLFYASFAVPFFVVVASHYRIRRSLAMSLQLALESVWKRLQVACRFSCDRQRSSASIHSAVV